MIREFRDVETKVIFEGGDASAKDLKKARKRLPTHLWEKARIKLDELDATTDLRQLRTPSNRLESLSGDRRGQRSIRINDRYRVCFVWRDGDSWNVEITDYH